MPIAEPVATAALQRIETHISFLTFDGSLVHKRKKPVHFPFIDLSTPELRLAACQQELALNRRLAPDVYLRVDEIRDGSGVLVDAELIMRLLPDRLRLTTLVKSGCDVTAELIQIAHVMASFHSTALRGSDIDQVATPVGLLSRWTADFDELEPLVATVLGVADLSRERALVSRYIAGRSHLLHQRIADGHIVDGHGDLLAEDIFCLPDGPRILDCLEFDCQLRYGDELADVAFLAMDLESLGRPDLAKLFARTYQRFAGEHYPASLLHLYIAQRAMVRSKVACLRAMQGDSASVNAARTFLNLCFRHLEFGRSLLVIVGGAPGTGKSTLAARLATTMGWVHLRSDEIRRDVGEVSHEQRVSRDRLDAGLYTKAMTDRTYAAMTDHAQLLLEAGCSVILDAGFSTMESRQQAEAVAQDTFSDLVELRCYAPPAVIDGRIGLRTQRRTDISEADPVIALELLGRQQRWPAAHSIDTTMGEAAQLVRCLRHIGETPVPGPVR